MEKEIFLERFNKEFEDEGIYKYLFYKRLVKAVLRQVEKDRGKILDVGSGHGELSIRAALEFPRAQVIGIDMSKEMIDKAKKKASNIGIENIDFVVSPIEDVEIADVDTIISSTTFHHIKNKKKALKRLFKLLPRNGKLIIGDMFKTTQSFSKEVDKLRARYPNSASEFDESMRQFVGDTGQNFQLENPDEYHICPADMKALLKEAGFRKQSIVKLPITDFAVVVGVK